jgi:chemotaxis protein histidine kinase CheA
VSEEILAAFAAESAENLEGMEDAILEFEQGGEGALDGLFRQVHTIKGSAGIVGLAHLQAFAHAIESRLSALRRHELEAKGKQLFSALLSCRDHISRLLSEGDPAIGVEREGEAGGGTLSTLDLEVLKNLDAALEATVDTRNGCFEKRSASGAGLGGMAASGEEHGGLTAAPAPAQPAPVAEPLPSRREVQPECGSAPDEASAAVSAEPVAVLNLEPPKAQRSDAALAGRTVEGFVARVGCTRLLVPLLDVLSCEDCRGRIRGRGERRSVDIDGRLVPAIDLRLLFDECPTGESGLGEAAIAMVCDSGGERTCLVVDEVGEAFALEVKSFGNRLAASPWLAGYALRDEGSFGPASGETMLLVLDVEGLISSFAN